MINTALFQYLSLLWIKKDSIPSPSFALSLNYSIIPASHLLPSRSSTCTGWLCSKTICMPPTQTTPTCSLRPVWSGSTALTARTTKWWPGWTREERCTSTTRDASLQVDHTHSYWQAFISQAHLNTVMIVLISCFPSWCPVRSHACEEDQFGKAGGCSDICLLGNGHKTRTCRCRSGFSLGSDGKSCKSKWGYYNNETTVTTLTTDCNTNQHKFVQAIYNEK